MRRWRTTPPARQRVARSAPAALARAAKRADAEAKRAEAAACRRAAAEARRAALPEQLQGRMAGQDLAPPTRPRRTPKPIDRLVAHDEA